MKSGRGQEEGLQAGHPKCVFSGNYKREQGSSPPPHRQPGLLTPPALWTPKSWTPAQAVPRQFSFLSLPRTWNSTHRCSINTCEGNAQELPGTLEGAALTPTSGPSVLRHVPSSTSFSKWNSATEASSGVFRPREGEQRSREQIPEPHCLVQTLDPLPTWITSVPQLLICKRRIIVISHKVVM